MREYLVGEIVSLGTSNADSYEGTHEFLMGRGIREVGEVDEGQGRTEHHLNRVTGCHAKRRNGEGDWVDYADVVIIRGVACGAGGSALPIYSEEVAGSAGLTGHQRYTNCAVTCAHRAVVCRGVDKSAG